MGTISEKLVYLNGTKQAIKQAINEDFEVIDDNTTFREYADEISSNNAKYKDLIPKETKNATNTLDISNSSGLDKALVTQYGNTYQEGEPTPDTPQEIVNISGKSTLKDVGKNLFDKNAITERSYVLNDGTLQTGTSYEYNTSDFIPVQPNTTYYKTLSLSPRTKFYDANKQVLDSSTYQDISIGGNAGSFTTPSNAYYFRFTINTNISTGVSLDSVILYRGDKATEYEPYQEQSFDLDLPSGVELCKIGDYKDRIYPLNGKWYLEKKIGKVVLDGTQTWARASATDGYRFTCNVVANQILIPSSISVIGNLLSDKFERVSANATSSSKNGIAIAASGNLVIYYDVLKNESSTNFNNWLLTHNVEVYYALTTPTTTEITESNYPTLYDQLNNIKLYEGVNHITMTNESGLDVEFDITYYKDWKLD